MKRNDWILTGVILLLALCIYLFQFFRREEGSLVVVSVDGRQTAVYSLSEDKIIDIDGYDGGNCRLEIKDNVAKVTEADCPDKLCMGRHGISRMGETIACLPNRVLISVSGGSPSKYDAIAD